MTFTTSEQVEISDKSLAVACAWSMVLSGTPASSTTKSGHHDEAEIFLKVALNTINQIKCIRVLCVP
jgi:hypothetical protein